MTADRVILDDLFLLGKGAHRRTYLHPDDGSKLIKIVHDQGQRRARDRKRYWSMGRRFDMDGNERELRSVELLTKAGQYDPRFFPAFFGTIETNLGSGLVFEKLGSAPEEQIYDLKMPEQKKSALEMLSQAQILAQYDELIAFFVKANVPNVGLGIENLAVVDRPGHPPQLMCFDLKFLEDRRLVPIADWFSWVSRRRVKRLLERAKTKFAFKLGEIS